MVQGAVVMKAILLWTGEGVYEPLLLDEQVEWWRNEDGAPLWGVQVDSIENARKFAAVKEFMLPLELVEAMLVVERRGL